MRLGIVAAAGLGVLAAVLIMPSGPGEGEPRQMGGVHNSRPLGLPPAPDSRPVRTTRDEQGAAPSVVIDGVVVAVDGGPLDLGPDDRVTVFGCGVAELPIGADGVFQVSDAALPCSLGVAWVVGGARSLGDKVDVTPDLSVELRAPVPPEYLPEPVDIDDPILGPTPEEAARMREDARRGIESTLANPATSPETRERLEAILGQLDDDEGEGDL